MFKILATFLLILVCTPKVHAGRKLHDIDHIVKKYVASLRRKGVDTILIYSRHPGFVNTICTDEKGHRYYEGNFVPTYIFWKKRGMTFVTKRDNCYNYSIFPFNADSVWALAVANIDSIGRERLKEPTWYEIRDGKQVTISSTMDDVGWQDFIFKIDKKLVRQTIQNYDTEKSIYYNYNIHTYTHRIEKILYGYSMAIEKERRMTIRIRKPWISRVLSHSR